jgi:hypothetical protein
MDGWMDGWMSQLRCTHPHPYGTHVLITSMRHQQQSSTMSYVFIERSPYYWSKLLINEWLDRWMEEGGMDGWMDGWMDGIVSRTMKLQSMPYKYIDLLRASQHWATSVVRQVWSKSTSSYCVIYTVDVIVTSLVSVGNFGRKETTFLLNLKQKNSITHAYQAWTISFFFVINFRVL